MHRRSKLCIVLLALIEGRPRDAYALADIDNAVAISKTSNDEVCLLLG